MVHNMNLLENKALLKNLLAQGDQLHTLGGGMVQVEVDMQREDDGFLIMVKAPSVSFENFKILTEGKFMQLFATRPNHTNDSFRVPLFYRKIDLPDYADVEGVIAEHKNNQLRVFIPIGLNTLQGKHEIKIKQI